MKATQFDMFGEPRTVKIEPEQRQGVMFDLLAQAGLNGKAGDTAATPLFGGVPIVIGAEGDPHYQTAVNLVTMYARNTWTDRQVIIARADAQIARLLDLGCAQDSPAVQLIRNFIEKG